jgi:hypothetical protein
LALQEATLFRMMSPSMEAAVTEPVELLDERPRSPEKSLPLTDGSNPSSVEVR